MYCPFCTKEETKVIDSRLVNEGHQVRRRRECLSCNERYTTYETAELVMPRIIKVDGRRAPFDEEKLRAGIMKALEKRPIGIEALESMMSRLMHRLRASGEREISSQVLGEWVMEELQGLDEVAYVRFASVYRHFQDIDAFQDEIARLQNSVNTKADALEHNDG